MNNQFKLNQFMLRSTLCISGMIISGCDSDDKFTAPPSNVELIVLEEGQTIDDILNPGGDSSGNPDTPDIPGSGDVTVTTEPEKEGEALFIRNAEPGQNIAGFEFCCGGFDAYQEHEFTDATGDFIELDGGFWGADVVGHIGERVFSSYGDGFDSDSDTSAAQVGPTATGTVMSPSFTINKDYINFLVGGGNNAFGAANTTAITLVVDNKVVRQATGNNQQNTIEWDSWDVRDLAGQSAQIKFIDMHPADNSDGAVPYILADEFRAADKPAKIPDTASVVSTTAPLTSSPESIGSAAFTRITDLGQNIAGFEFCCGQYNTYQEHSFIVTGDFIKLDGGFWGADITNHIGERVFSSRSDGFEEDGTSLGWIGDSATGTLITPSFTINEKYINFLIGGGTNAYSGDKATAMVLRVNGKIVRHATGNGEESKMDWYSWDVASLKGQKAVIEIIDQHDASEDDGSLAFILVDEIRQGDRAAVNPSQASVVSTTVGHSQELKLDLGDPNPFYDNGSYYIYYLQNSGFHSWALAKTDDLLTSTFPQEVLAASGNPAQQDQWIGSGSVIKDQEGQYHLFYTGHNADFNPVEAVMHATAKDNTLAEWEPVAADTFSGTSGYSDFDFRDPLVFWNANAQKYWMLITSRYQSKAAIGLYTSTDLSNWNAETPLYSETSNLNLEVADYFTLTDTPFIVYSDQRDDSRQVKYLTQDNTIWGKPEYEALDGRAFYAARTAGTNEERLLFGWVAHNIGRVDGNAPDWGGDLMVHQVTESNGELSVHLPQKLRDGIATTMATTSVWTSGSVTASETNPSLTSDSAITLAPSANKNRITMTVTSDNVDAKFGIQLRKVSEEQADKNAFIEIDAGSNQAKFYFEGDANNNLNPTVSLPLDLTAGVKIDILLDPAAGVGVVYMDDFRALSFRLYELADYEVGLYSTADNISVNELARFTK